MDSKWALEHKIGFFWQKCIISVLDNSKECSRAGICEIYGKESVRITNSQLIFLDTSCPEQVLDLGTENS